MLCNHIAYSMAFDRMCALLDASSAVHFRSTPLSIPDSTHGTTFYSHLFQLLFIVFMRASLPKRSAPWLFTTAPLGGLFTSFMRPLALSWCPLLQDDTGGPTVQLVSTISITACSKIYCRCTASRHTIQRAGLQPKPFQAASSQMFLFCFNFKYIKPNQKIWRVFKML
jgi:hypothetical protein